MGRFRKAFEGLQTVLRRSCRCRAAPEASGWRTARAVVAVLALAGPTGLAGLAGWGTLAGAARAQTAGAPLTQAEVSEAIAVLKADLYSLQDPETGGWYGAFDNSPRLDDPPHDELLTVTATLALLRSGESPDVEPRLQRAVERVVWGEEQADSVVATQVVGIRAEIWPLLPGDEHDERLRRDGQRLLRAASASGTFETLLTDEADAQDWNHRVIQYAVAGIAAAQAGGLSVPDAFWKAAAAHFIEVQAPSGGWSHGPRTEPNASMTCAGLSVLLTARAEVRSFVEAEKPEAALEEAINRGLAFLDGELTGDKTVYGGSGYLFYGLEQVALQTGRRRLGGTEWFQEMGRYVVDRALARGDSVHGQVVNASWFLTFLSRGRVPLAFNKLTLGDAISDRERLRRPGAGAPDAAGRSNDVHFLTTWLSTTFESELNWQRVDLDEPVESLLAAPASLLMLDGPWEPEPEQVDRLRRYLDLGGLLVVVPTGPTFNRVRPAVARLVEQLGSPTDDPAAEPLALERVEDDHPASGLWRSPRRPVRFFAAHNGARDLVLLASEDLGQKWQRSRRTGDVLFSGANLHLFASGYGDLPARVASEFPADRPAPAAASAEEGGPSAIARVRVVRCGVLAGREPALWEATRRRMAAAGGLQLEVESQSPAGLGEPAGEAAAAGEEEPAGELNGADLLHLVGVGDEPAPPAAISAAAAFAQAGGTVFVESLGGRGGFAEATIAVLAAELGAAVGPLAPGTGPLAADPARPGTVEVATATFRPFSLQRFDAGTTPSFESVSIGGRVAIVASSADVSLGALGSRQWGIHGYGLQTAATLAENLILHAHRGEQPADPP